METEDVWHKIDAAVGESPDALAGALRQFQENERFLAAEVLTVSVGGLTHSFSSPMSERRKEKNLKGPVQSEDFSSRT